jgi:hypothetical protein
MTGSGSLSPGAKESAIVDSGEFLEGHGDEGGESGFLGVRAIQNDLIPCGEDNGNSVFAFQSPRCLSILELQDYRDIEIRISCAAASNLPDIPRAYRSRKCMDRADLGIGR